MISLAYQIIRTTRPRQWLKNVSVFAAPVFAGLIFEPNIILKGIYAFGSFSILASAIYFINDIMDAEKDRMHPVKKNRPIASGKINEPLAWVIALILLGTAIILSLSLLGKFFAFACIGYAFLMILYSTFFRNVIIIDALTVAAGFVIRVYAGAIAIEVSISSWLILATIGLSLLLAFGKRRSEKTLLNKQLENTKTRKTLKHYPDNLLDSMISMSASFSIITYALFAFQISPEKSINESLEGLVPAILSSPKLMMLTIPIVIYGVARYLYVIYEKNEGESPARVLLSDKPLLTTVTLWGLMVIAIAELT
jgi:4-hydroxybenzoate polyprenyltransferase